MDILDHILGQIADAREELAQIPPPSINWTDRAEAAARLLVPRLQTNAAALTGYVGGVLNSPILLNEMWTALRPQIMAPPEQIEAFDRQLALDDILRQSITGDTISKLIMTFLLENFEDLGDNGRSDYPDIFIATNEYGALPTAARQARGETLEYIPVRKGSQGRPVRIPDGLEVKTARHRINIDCHYNHPGMHLVLVFELVDRLYTVTDLRVGFLRSSDYIRRGRNIETTTVKYSFNGTRFHSLLASQTASPAGSS